MDQRKAYLLYFVVIVAFALVGMVFGPFGYDSISITFSVIAGLMALFGIVSALRGWKRD